MKQSKNVNEISVNDGTHFSFRHVIWFVSNTGIVEVILSVSTSELHNVD